MTGERGIGLSTAGGPDPTRLDFTGGPYGRGAQILAEVATMRRFADLCTRLADEAIAATRVARDAFLGAQPELLSTALLAPWTAAAVERDLTRALCAPPRAYTDALELAVAVRAAAAGYERVDDAVRLGWEVVDTAASPLSAGLLLHSAALKAASTASAAAAVDAVVQPDAALLEHVVNGSAPLVFPLTAIGAHQLNTEAATGKGINPPPGPLELAALGLASLYAPRPASLSSATQLADRPAPTSLADLYAALDPPPESTHGAAPAEGRVDVIRRDWVDGDGQRRSSFVVVLPGTASWEPPGRDEDNDVRDLHANARLLAGRSTAETDALPEVLARAGVPAGAAIALVGHSQGGMTAVRAARDPRVAGTYRVGHVLTAGSPIATMHPPGRARVLSLEDRRDPVPAFDGERNRDRPGHLTVRFDGPAAGGFARHGMRGYVEGARRLDGAVTASRAREEIREGSSVTGGSRGRRADAAVPGRGGTQLPAAARDGVRGAADFDASLRREGLLAEPGSTERVTVTRVEVTVPHPPRPGP